MHNSFIAEKNLRQQFTNKKREKKVAAWFHRYKTEVQPNLVINHHKRINGFAKKMEDDPFVIQKQTMLTPDKKFRASDPKLNISQQQFKFRDVHDWTNVYTPLQRKYGQEKPKISRRTLRSQSQTRYMPSKVEYRSRDKSKEINPPMRYNFSSSKRSNRSLSRKIQNIHKYRVNTDDNTTNIHGTVSRQSLDSDRESGIGNLSDLDLVSLYNASLTKKEHRKTELELLQEAELKNLAQEKLYFKSLSQLSQKLGNQKQRDQIKQTLKKCGLIPELGIHKKENVDRFIEIIKD